MEWLCKVCVNSNKYRRFKEEKKRWKKNKIKRNLAGAVQHIQQLRWLFEFGTFFAAITAARLPATAKVRKYVEIKFCFFLLSWSLWSHHHHHHHHGRHHHHRRHRNDDCRYLPSPFSSPCISLIHGANLAVCVRLLVRVHSRAHAQAHAFKTQDDTD